jgi:hypothetical protein
VVSCTTESLLVVDNLDSDSISRAGRILTRLKAMVPLTVRDTVACPLRASPARCYYFEWSRGGTGGLRTPGFVTSGEGDFGFACRHTAARCAKSQSSTIILILAT